MARLPRSVSPASHVARWSKDRTSWSRRLPGCSHLVLRVWSASRPAAGRGCADDGGPRCLRGRVVGRCGDGLARPRGACRAIGMGGAGPRPGGRARRRVSGPAEGLRAAAGPVPWSFVVSVTAIDKSAPPVAGAERAETIRSGGPILIETDRVLFVSLDSVSEPSPSARAMTYQVAVDVPAGIVREVEPELVPPTARPVIVGRRGECLPRRRSCWPRCRTGLWRLPPRLSPAGSGSCRTRRWSSRRRRSRERQGRTLTRSGNLKSSLVIVQSFTSPGLSVIEPLECSRR